MKGTIVNTISIIIGGSLGMMLGAKLKKRFKETVMQGLSLSVLLIGIQMALSTNNPTYIIFSLLIGGLIGEAINIEDKLESIGKWFERRLGNRGRVAEGFVQCSLIYCVGAMAIMGAIQDGLQHDPSTLYAKALLDGFSGIAFASTLGIGVILSAIPVFLYQGAITLLASQVKVFLTDPIITEMTATGGLLILAIALNMLNITKIKVGNLLPAIFVVIALVYLF
ncbi:hypothetical protein BX659_105175 [Orenia metallireducens]|jgi:hypothetical protein|uniref:DUF554 domain-containing protein n=1 Tax=Orenia metallireducens TaxID=1413210 RepID=A0A285G275_9FIRM|nr:DUF554 domain-containing protein [Orenia metallireducens]PRX31844.1 hypothetical protein BX659_105175 [Orenia metallireducens]SNY17670.1 hypothetical protein SAMN06265827_104175 [Orenia metallireducens]